MSLEDAIAAIRSLQIPEERPNLSTNALLGLIAAKYGIVARNSTPEAATGPSAPSVDEPWWNYVLCCLDCLNSLCSALRPSEDAEPRISLHQKTLIKERLEFVVALGLYSHLDEGVGLPIASRLYSAEQFVPPRQGFRPDRVRLIVDCLMRVYETAELTPLLLSSFLHDLLVGLLSLSFAPQMRSERGLMNRYQARLRRVTTSGSPPIRDVIREIFVIQGALGDEKSKLSRAPRWLRFACSQVLTKQIEKSSDGVLPVLLGFFDFAGHGREADKCCAIAEVIVRPPRSLAGEELERHWRCVAGQVLKMLDSEEALLVRFAVTFINSFTKRYPDRVGEMLLDPVFGSAVSCLTSKKELNQRQDEVLNALELHALLLRLDKFVSNSFDFCDMLVGYLLKFVELTIFIVAYQTANETPALDIACGLLNCLSPEPAGELLMSIILQNQPDSIGSSICLRTNEDGSLSLRKWNGLCADENRWGVEEGQIVDATHSVLHRLPSLYQGRFFISLLQRLRHLVLQESTPQLQHPPTGDKSSRKDRPDLLLSLISVVADKFPECCLSHPEQIVELAKETLCRFRYVQDVSSDALTAEFSQETVSLSLGLISSVLVSSTTAPGVDVSPAVRSALAAAQPVVADVAASHPHDGLRQLATDLRLALATHGHVGLDKTRPLVQEVAPEGEVGEALRDAVSALVPVRGHALIVLSRAVEERRAEVDDAAMRGRLLRIFLEATGHADSYIYLSGVRGLAALAGREPREVLPLLLDRLAAAKEGNGDTAEAEAEFRLKLGEAVMRCVRELGEMVPSYRDRLLNVFLARCRLERRPMLRAAALSNLAEICRLLRFGLHTCLHEVLAACGGLLEGDDSPEVRSAAAFLLLSLFRGVDQQMWTMVDGEALRDIYRLLRRREKVEREEKVHKMILLACNELDDIVRASLLPGDKKRPVKEIRIL